ncbi:MAG: prepilin-type N-terminal cleavage/methylation domain-containing protein [Planctomycetes bacterium]|nr:prepilin-type N-terminal cleavage/methylation domain-containing protein [Planctomycetota bacterium]
MNNGLHGLNRLARINRMGFTLIELLVVISIIGIAASIAIAFFPKGESVKHSGRIIQATFIRGGMLASSQRAVYFIAFDKEKSLMTIYKHKETDDESDDTPKLDTQNDEQIGESISLPRGVKFGDTPLLDSTGPYVGFKGNGTMFLPDGVEDKSFKPPPDSPVEADIILEQTGRPGKMYLDFTILTGRIRRTVYREE